MRPEKSTSAHQTDKFAELVCSNSLKSESENTGPWLLKKRCAAPDRCCCAIARKGLLSPPDTPWQWIAMPFADRSY